jgi:hypothetical protein
MSDFTLSFPLRPSEFHDGKKFLHFLRVAGRRHSVTLTIGEGSTGELTLSVPREKGTNLDSFLQELIFTRGLYYYLCSIPNRVHVARRIVKPIFEELLQSTFSVVYPVQIQTHLLEGSQTWTAGEFITGVGQQYDLLYQQFRLKMISGYEFIRNLDDLLTEFMLEQLDHKKGDESPKFNILVDRCGKEDILRNKEVRYLFNEVHSLRTRGLHRLEREIPEAELSKIAHTVHNVFGWLDDYFTAQDEKTVMRSGRRYRRVRYGQEMRYWKRSALLIPTMATKEFQVRWSEIIKQPCHDCDVVIGELHLDRCDLEVCPRCAGQHFSCDCEREED